MELFCEISNALVQVRNQKFFRARVFVKLGHFDKDFVKGTGKKGPTGKHFGDCSPYEWKI